MWNGIAFIVLTLVLVYISRKSLGSTQSHGFYRFLAWECILGLFLLNMRFWFVEPLAWNQLIAWTLLFASLIPLGFGVHFLQAQGRQVDKREGDPSLYGFEKTTNLVTSGIYKYIRHPLYCSLLLLTWGIFFKHITLTVATLAVTATAFLIFTAKADEAECIRFFGGQYQEYMKRSKMFIPFIF
jgi:protein-S-isoprenylcysteine O-methyltransferase Ste14